jgi:uncharacterized small protein (DUF1192 family)
VIQVESTTLWLFTFLIVLLSIFVIRIASDVIGNAMRMTATNMALSNAIERIAELTERVAVLEDPPDEVSEDFDGYGYEEEDLVHIDPERVTHTLGKQLDLAGVQELHRRDEILRDIVEEAGGVFELDGKVYRVTELS